MPDANVGTLHTSRRLDPGDHVPTRWAVAGECIVVVME
jgi:hypothetical protein